MERQKLGGTVRKRTLALPEQKVGKREVSYKTPDAYKTSIRVTKKQSRRFRSALTREGYGIRRKSLWVSEAIHDFFTDEEWMKNVLYDLNNDTLEETERLNLDPDLQKPLEEAAQTIKKTNPDCGYISSVIWNAIDMRIIRNGRYDASPEDEDE